MRRDGSSLWWPAVASGKSVLFVCLCLIMMSLTWTAAAEQRGPALVWLGVAVVVGGVCLTWWRGSLRRLGDSGGEGFWASAAVIVLVGIAGRLVVSFGTTPVLSDDIWRYIHDGSVLASGQNPYAEAPAEIDAGRQILPEVIARTNNPELVTIYLPASQWVFAGITKVYEALPEVVRAVDPLRDRTFRVAFGLIDGLTVLFLLLLLRDMGRSPWCAALYAWHPLVFAEVAGSGHQDPIGIAPLVLMVGCWVRVLKADRFKAVSAMTLGVAFSLSLLVKPMALLLLPAIVVTLWRRRAALGLAAGSAVATGLVVGLPFVLMEGGVARLFETGERFVDAWAFNGSVHALLQWFFVEKGRADQLAGLMLAGVACWLAWRRTDPVRAAGWVVLSGLLVSSTAHPWYALWMLPFVAITRNRAGWLLSLTIPLAYVAHMHEGYRLPQWVVWIEYLPVIVVLIYELSVGADQEARLSAD